MYPGGVRIADDTSTRNAMKVLQLYSKPIDFSHTNGRIQAQAMAGGGIGVYLDGLVHALRRQGIEVVTVRITDTISVDQLHNNNEGHYRIGKLSYRNGRRTYSQLRRIVHTENPDLVHIHSIYYATHPTLISRLSRWVPVVCTLHDVTSLCFNQTKLLPDGVICDRPAGLGCLTSGCYRIGRLSPPATDLLRVAAQPLHIHAMRCAKAVIVPSAYLKSQCIVNGMDERQVVVIPNYSRFAGIKATAKNSNQPCRILFTGRLIPEKGILKLIDAFYRIGGESWTAEIIGDGPLLDEAKQQVHLYRLQNRVQFTGELNADELQTAYASCSLLVMPSLIPESFGLAGIEAMSFARPVVAFNAGGISQWLIDNVNGLMVEHGDVDALAEALRTLIRNDTVRSQLGENAKHSVEKLYSPDHHLHLMTDLYQRCVKHAEVKTP